MRLSIKTISLLLAIHGYFLSFAQKNDSVPLFSFGLLADVQYADVDQAGKRDYRGSLQRLRNSIEVLNSHELEFVIHAGDLIDRHYESFDSSFSLFSESKADVHYVIGNHEFSVHDSLKSRVRKMLNNPKGYYDFVVDGFQFILLDAMDISVHASTPGSREYAEGLAMQAELKSKGANNAYDWNGGIGSRQMKWLKSRLRSGKRKNLKTILFSHLPLLPENGLQMWNNREILNLVEKYSSVVAFVSGHHHEGGYVKAGHIHHLTLKGLVEATTLACAVAHAFADRIVVEGFGDQKDYTLYIDVR